MHNNDEKNYNVKIVLNDKNQCSINNYVTNNKNQVTTKIGYKLKILGSEEVKEEAA